jgi:hypothetical protein
MTPTKPHLATRKKRRAQKFARFGVGDGTNHDRVLATTAPPAAATTR